MATLRVLNKMLARLGLLENIRTITCLGAKVERQALVIEVIDNPLVCHGNILVAGGCLWRRILWLGLHPGHSHGVMLKLLS